MVDPTTKSNPLGEGNYPLGGNKLPLSLGENNPPLGGNNPPLGQDDPPVGKRENPSFVDPAWDQKDGWRPMLYVNYHKRFFVDPKNWNDREKLFD